MAFYSTEELRSIIPTGRKESFGLLVAMVNGIIADYVNAHTPEAERAAILDSGAAQSAQLQLLRLNLTATELREEATGDYRYNPRSLRFEQVRILRQLPIPAQSMTGE